MPSNEIRRGVWAAVLAAMGALAIVVTLIETRRPAAVAVHTPPAINDAAEAAAAPSSAGPNAASARTRPQTPAEEVPYIEGLVWGDIDLREAQAVMPDNLYWDLGAPTKDPAVIEARDEEKKRRNEEYGRVLAGDANEDEVRAYYEYREHLSTDYLEFSRWMLNRYDDDTLSEELRGMLELAVRLHSARLVQIPAEREDALERSREREKIRAEWRRQQEEFESVQP